MKDNCNMKAIFTLDMCIENLEIEVLHTEDTELFKKTMFVLLSFSLKFNETFDLQLTNLSSKSKV